MLESIAELSNANQAEYPYHPQPPILPFDPDLGNSTAIFWQTNGGLVLAAVLSGIFVLADFSIVPLMLATPAPGIGVVGVFALIGTIFAQAALLSLPFVFGEAKFWRRLTYCASATIVLWGVWQLGFIAAQLYDGWNAREYAEVIQVTGLALPLAAIAVQWPLWFFRLYLGWRFRLKDAGESPAPPLSIRDYLLGTALAALAVSFARLAPAETWDLKDYWMGWAIFFGFGGVTTFAFVAPCMFWMFRFRDWRIACGLILVYGVVGGVVALGVLLATIKDFRDDVLTGSGRWEAASMVAAYATFGVFLAAGLKAARDMGLELVAGRPLASRSLPPASNVVDAPRAGAHAKE